MKNMTEQQLIKKLVEERDLALSQLASIGVGLGDNMDHVKKALEQQTPKNDSWTETCLAIQKILIEYGVEPLGELANAIFDAVPQYGWIPASEPPKEEGEYLCTLQGKHDNGTAQQCGFIPYSAIGLIPGWSTCDADGFIKLDAEEVIAWMPLPEPYKDGE